VTAFYDFFRKIKLQSPPGETLETVEADEVLDTLTLLFFDDAILPDYAYKTTNISSGAPQAPEHLLFS